MPASAIDPVLRALVPSRVDPRLYTFTGLGPGMTTALALARTHAGFPPSHARLVKLATQSQGTRVPEGPANPRDATFERLFALRHSGNWASAVAIVAHEVAERGVAQTPHFNMALALCARSRQWRAMELLEARMVYDEVPPDGATMHVFMVAAMMAGQWSDALAVFRDARRFSKPSSEMLSLGLRAASVPNPPQWYWALAHLSPAVARATVTSEQVKQGLLIADRVNKPEVVVNLYTASHERTALDRETLLVVGAAAEAAGAWHLAVELAQGALTLSAPSALQTQLTSSALRASFAAKKDRVALLVQSMAVRMGVRLEPSAHTSAGDAAERSADSATAVRVLGDAIGQLSAAPAALYAAALNAAEREHSVKMQHTLLSDMCRRGVDQGDIAIQGLLCDAERWVDALRYYGSLRNVDTLSTTLALRACALARIRGASPVLDATAKAVVGRIRLCRASCRVAANGRDGAAGAGRRSAGDALPRDSRTRRGRGDGDGGS